MISRWINRRDSRLCQCSDVILLMRSLLRQLTSDMDAVDGLSLQKLNAMIFDGRAHIATIWTDDCKTLVGMGMLTIRQHVLRKVAHIDDVVVDEAYRGRGFGKEIVKALIDQARVEGANHIELSTRSHRVVALGLYKSLGFQESETRSLCLHL